MNKSEYIAQLLGLNSLPTESSGKGAWGAYESDINDDQLRQLQKFLGYTPSILPFLGNPNLLGNGGYIPLTGTSGGLRAEQAGEDGNYRLSYTPNAEGTNMALHQSDIAGSKNADMMGTMIVGGILGAGMLGLGSSGVGQYASVSDALAAGDFAAADAMGAAAFNAGGGISGLGSSLGGGGLFGAGGVAGTGWSSGNALIDKAVERGITSFITSGGDPQKVAASIATGGILDFANIPGMTNGLTGNTTVDKLLGGAGNSIAGSAINGKTPNLLNLGISGASTLFNNGTGINYSTGNKTMDESNDGFNWGSEGSDWVIDDNLMTGDDYNNSNTYIDPLTGLKMDYGSTSFIDTPGVAGNANSSWLANIFGSSGASLIKSIAPDLWKAVIGGVATDKQKKDFAALANKTAEMANPGAYFQRNTIWPALEEAIKTGNKPNAQTLAGLHQLMQSGADPNSDLRKQSANGFAAANDLVTNPMGNSGYSLADQAAQLYASLNSDPYSNPLISQTFENAMEAAARKSAASGRLQGGNFLADSRNATTGAVVDASGKLGTQYGNAINSGMNMYDTQFKDALGLGTGAAGTANQNITAGAGGLNSLANLQEANSNYIRDLGNIAGFGSPEAAAAAYKGAKTDANKLDPWTTALYNGGTKIIDSLVSKW